MYVKMNNKGIFEQTPIVETQCRVLDPANLMYLQLTETSEKSCIEESKRPALYFNLFYVFCHPKQSNLLLYAVREQAALGPTWPLTP